MAFISVLHNVWHDTVGQRQLGKATALNGIAGQSDFHVLIKKNHFLFQFHSSIRWYIGMLENEKWSVEALETFKVRFTLCAGRIWLIVVSPSTVLARLLQPWGKATQSHQRFKNGALARLPFNINILLLLAPAARGPSLKRTSRTCL